MEEHRHAAGEGMRASIEALQSPEYDFVLLDEVCFALANELVPLTPWWRRFGVAAAEKLWQ